MTDSPWGHVLDMGSEPRLLPAEPTAPKSRILEAVKLADGDGPPDEIEDDDDGHDHSDGNCPCYQSGYTDGTRDTAFELSQRSAYSEVPDGERFEQLLDAFAIMKFKKSATDHRKAQVIAQQLLKAYRAL